MVNRIDTTTARNTNKRSDDTSTRKSPKKDLNDDIILSLSDAHENRRARQVIEWEKMRRHTIQTIH